MNLLRKQIHWGINSAMRTSEETYLGLPVVRDWQQSEGQAIVSIQVPPWLRQRGKKLRHSLAQLYQQLIRAPAPGLPLRPITEGPNSLFCWVHHEIKFFPEPWLTLLELIKLKVFQSVQMSPFSSRYLWLRAFSAVSFQLVKRCGKKEGKLEFKSLTF